MRYLLSKSCEIVLSAKAPTAAAETVIYKSLGTQPVPLFAP